MRQCSALPCRGNISVRVAAQFVKRLPSLAGAGSRRQNLHARPLCLLIDRLAAIHAQGWNLRASPRRCSGCLVGAMSKRLEPPMPIIMLLLAPMPLAKGVPRVWTPRAKANALACFQIYSSGESLRGRQMQTSHLPIPFQTYSSGGSLTVW